ncbi:hypothetical protein Y032_0146g2552 [Ancylostoma ceylanicum]|uniref:7TM GPCR serpentine receptor class x (Srx) domain-containing protein n=2 Tax=Ancylostoma ceylanicum TaxID=53326 RepID=A0A016T2B4_9BILA|nr:hypothetical protein Y032_0146g2552 [Ancylostoma ceylanicum]
MGHLVGCLYFFEPYDYTFYFNYNLCFHVHRIVEWFFAGVILAISTLADILIAFALLKQRKKSGMDVFKDIRDFSFMLQTLVLSFTNGISTLYLYTFGADSAQIPWIDHIPKLLDLLLALIYTLAIALINNVVRAELMDFIRCRTSKVNLIQSTAVVTQITTRKATAWTS